MALAVAVYTKKNCVQCTATKNWLDKRGIAYTAVDVEEDADGMEYALDTGIRQMPIVELEDGTRWGGHQPNRLEVLEVKDAA